MARGFYGRIRAYQDGVESDDRALRAALARNLYGTVRESAPWIGAMAALCARGGRRAGPPTGGGPAVRPGPLSARRGRGARGRGRGRDRRSGGRAMSDGRRRILPAGAAGAARRRSRSASRSKPPPTNANASPAGFDLVALDRLTRGGDPAPPGGRDGCCSKPSSRPSSRRAASSPSNRFAGAVSRIVRVALRAGRRDDRAKSISMRSTSRCSSRSAGDGDRHRRGGGPGIVAGAPGISARTPMPRSSRSTPRRSRR